MPDEARLTVVGLIDGPSGSVAGLPQYEDQLARTQRVVEALSDVG
jgi:hypothetical protein